MAGLLRIDKSTEAPALKPQLRGGDLAFGHIRVRVAEGVREDHLYLYDLLSETLSRIPGGFGFASLARIDFMARHVEKTAAVTQVYRASKSEGDIRGIQRIRLYPDLLSCLNEKSAMGVMAHELAHAWLNEYSGPEDSEKREREADSLARRWGFGAELDALSEETETVYRSPAE